jgi:hypothetical protein
VVAAGSEAEFKLMGFGVPSSVRGTDERLAGATHFAAFGLTLTAKKAIRGHKVQDERDAVRRPDIFLRNAIMKVADGRTHTIEDDRLDCGTFRKLIYGDQVARFHLGDHLSLADRPSAAE